MGHNFVKAGEMLEFSLIFKLGGVWARWRDAVSLRGRSFNLRESVRERVRA
jgi:hypothetical protein